MRPPLSTTVPRLTVTALAGLLLTGCSGSAPATYLPSAAPTTRAPTGDLSGQRLAALLLQPADLPGLTQRREFTSAAVTTQATPQLALCRPAVATAPHELANVIAQSGAVGTVKVFEIVGAYADAAGAQAAYDADVANARACTSYTAAGVAYAVEDLAPVTVPAPAQALHYRLTTPAVVGGDVRTYAVQGRFTVLVTGFGAPPAGQPLLDYQADVLRKALARLPPAP